MISVHIHFKEIDRYTERKKGFAITNNLIFKMQRLHNQRLHNAYDNDIPKILPSK